MSTSVPLQSIPSCSDSGFRGRGRHELPVTVLVCTANRPELLRRALQSLAAGEERPGELVVVNGGNDTTNDVVAACAPEFQHVILIQYANVNLAVSRNLGLPYCCGHVVAMTDDDAEVMPNWILALRRVHAELPNAGAVGGPVLGLRADRFTSRVADAVVFPDAAVRRAIHTLPGVNVSYKRAAIEAAGRFDEALLRGEDVDFNQRVAAAGFELIFDPDVRVRHEHRPTLRGLLDQQYMYGRAYVPVRARHPQLYSVYPRSVRTWRDVLKLGYFVAGAFLDPLRAARRLKTPRDRIMAYPLLVSLHATWKVGMIRELLDRSPGTMPVTSIHRYRIRTYECGVASAWRACETEPPRV